MKNVNVLLLVVATFICSTNCMEKSEKEMFQAAKNMFQTWKAKNGKRYDNETQEKRKDFKFGLITKKTLTNIIPVLLRVLKHTQKNCINITIRQSKSF